MKGTVGGFRVGREIARIIPVMLQPTSRPKTTAGFLWGDCQIFRSWLVMFAKTENPSPKYSALPHGRECGAPTWGQTTKGRTFNAAACPPAQLWNPLRTRERPVRVTVGPVTSRGKILFSNLGLVKDNAISSKDMLWLELRHSLVGKPIFALEGRSLLHPSARTPSCYGDNSKRRPHHRIQSCP